MRVNFKTIYPGLFGLVLLLSLSGCAIFDPVVEENILTGYKNQSPKIKLPTIIKNQHTEAYFKGYVKMGRITLKRKMKDSFDWGLENVGSEIKQVILKEAAKRGADLVMLTTYRRKSFKGGGRTPSITKYHDNLGGSHESWNWGYRAPTMVNYQYINVDMYVHDPQNAPIYLDECIKVRWSYTGLSRQYMSVIDDANLIEKYIQLGADVNREANEWKMPPLYRLLFFCGIRDIKKDLQSEYSRNNVLTIAKLLINAGANVNAIPSGKNTISKSGAPYFGTNGMWLSPVEVVNGLIEKRLEKRKMIETRYVKKYGEKLNVTGKAERVSTGRKKAWRQLGISGTDDLEAYYHAGEAKLQCLRDLKALLEESNRGVGSTAKTPADELKQRKIPYSKTEFLIRVKDGDTTVADLFLAAGMNPDTRDQDGITALMYASHSGHLEIVNKLLEKGADVNATSNIGSPVITFASYGGNIEIAKRLMKEGIDIKQRDKRGWTPLMDAAETGHTDMGRFLISEGVDVNAQSNTGWTALMGATSKGHLDFVELLVSKGADMNAKNNKGYTAVQFAQSKGHTDIVKYLTSKGAKVD